MSSVPNGFEHAAALARHHQQRLTKPPGSLGALESIAISLCGIQHTLSPVVRPAAAILFAADHPVARGGVSAYPAEVTAAMMENFCRGGAASTVMADYLQIPVHLVDVGVDTPWNLPQNPVGVASVTRRTVQAAGDLRTEDALTVEGFRDAWQTGVDQVRDLGPALKLLLLGEMGIGNTTAASAVIACCLGWSAERVVGRGTGVDDDGLARKRAAVATACARIAGETEPLTVLRRVGGRELVAMAGAFHEACERGVATLVDGFVVTAALLPVLLHQPKWRTFALYAHRSDEAAHGAVLDLLGATPLLALGMRLGEASGALAAFSLCELACQLHTRMATMDMLTTGSPDPQHTVFTE